MLDIYIEGDVSRISPEAPIPIISNPQEKFICGGAANVAMNLASLGFDVTFLTNIGSDKNGMSLLRMLEGANIEVVSFDDDYHTITKERYQSKGHQILRVDTERPYPAAACQKLEKYFEAIVDTADGIVFSDYNKGVLNGLPKLIEIARTAGKDVYIDPKNPDITRYRGATCITPNKLEAHQLFHGLSFDDIQLIKPADYGLNYIIITLAENGALILTDEGAEHVATTPTNVVDVTGAGDCFISSVVFSCLTRTQSMGEVVQQAVEVSSKSVTQTGNYILKPADHDRETIVFTNGCFDILHAGHIDFLQYAASLGSKLVVGLNTDESVKLLKGPNRPINTFEQRKYLLSSLVFVDRVIGFAEETPGKLIESLRPDVLIKGADYELHEIAGADFVTSYGGSVVTKQFTFDTSTSKLITTCQNIDT